MGDPGLNRREKGAEIKGFELLNEGNQEGKLRESRLKRTLNQKSFRVNRTDEGRRLNPLSIWL